PSLGRALQCSSGFLFRRALAPGVSNAQVRALFLDRFNLTNLARVDAPPSAHPPRALDLAARAREPYLVPPALLLEPPVLAPLVPFPIALVRRERDEPVDGDADSPTERRQKPDPPRGEAEHDEAEHEDRGVHDDVDAEVPIERDAPAADPGFAFRDVHRLV